MITKLTNCRICHSDKLKPFFNLGPMPLPNGFLEPSQIVNEEPLYPLSVGVCTDCSLVQLINVVSPETMFRNYVYIPSASKTRLENFNQIATEAVKFYPPPKQALAIDIGSNDGSLLLEFKKFGIKVLGIDPATNLARIAQLKGIETLNAFFGLNLARKIMNQFGLAQYVTATNVVAHVHNLHDFFAGVRVLLNQEGVFICEFPYLVDLLEKKLFDTIYQEHLSYFTVKPLLRLLEKNKLKIIHIQRTPIDGGALRLIIARSDAPYPPHLLGINPLIKLEDQLKLDRLSIYRQFSRQIRQLRYAIKTTLTKLKGKNKTIAGYGASARGNILLNYCGIGTKTLDFIVDSTPYKQGLYTPGTHIKIFPEEEIINRRPDYVLILAWNFAKEIMKKQNPYHQKGGKFIIPVPDVTII